MSNDPESDRSDALLGASSPKELIDELDKDRVETEECTLLDDDPDPAVDADVSSKSAWTLSVIFLFSKVLMSLFLVNEFL